MRCDTCNGRGFLTAGDIQKLFEQRLAHGMGFSGRFVSMNDGVQMPCVDCGGHGEVSCCEGSARHGQLEGPTTIEVPRRGDPSS